MQLALLFLINTIVVGLAVVTHYEALSIMVRLIPRMRHKGRVRLLAGVTGVLTAHVVEVWIFALAFHFMGLWGQYGTLQGNYSGGIMDSVYFSFSSFSTVGYGDIEPLGDLRYLAGIEALTGLLLIAWSSSFLFVLMERNWMRVKPTDDFATEQDELGGE